MSEPPPHAPGRESRNPRPGLPAWPARRPASIADAWQSIAERVPRLATLADAWPRLARALRRARTGIWRVSVADASMRPAIEPGDWLLIDPTVRRWPRHGAVVVAREPETDLLVIKRVAARPGDHVHLRQGLLHLSEDEAWLLGDAEGSVDSRRYGPVTADRLVGRAWFRYWPPRRIGVLRRR